MDWILTKKDGQPIEVTASVRKAVPEELEALFALQDRVCKSMADPDQFIPNGKEEMLDNITNHLTIGVWVDDTPIALAIVHYDGVGSKNYANYLGVPESDKVLWANADTVIVDPVWRGNGLQQRLVKVFCQWRKPEIIGMGCTVSPKNQYSLKNMQDCGFQISSRRTMYGTHDRYVLSCTMLPLPGLYRHFKGNEYRVLGHAKNSETEEMMVIYQPQYGERAIWVRPASMWFEHVDRENYHGPRFMYVGE